MRFLGLQQRGFSLFTFLFVMVLFGANASWAVKGRVICDKQGVENVVVTDGKYFATTDAKGRYSLPANEEATWVYLSVPSGYLAPCSNGVTQFFKKIEAGRDSGYDFTLSKNLKSDRSHRFILFSDVQVKKMKEVDKFEAFTSDAASFIAASSDSIDHFGIDCGDVVGDNHDLYPAYIDKTKKIGIPIAHAIGNHDMDYYGRSHETSYHTFENVFGPTNYSFNKGNAHYIVLNDVYYVGREYFYIGSLTEKTLAWLEKDLSYLKKGALVFVAMHIPSTLSEKVAPFEYSFRIAEQMTNAQALHNMLKPFNAHILSGHTHYNKNIVISDRLFEHNVGAASGAWWQGDVCVDGTPIGYGVFDVNGDDVKWHFKSVGKPSTYQIRAYPLHYSSSYDDYVVANIWNWDSSWKVEWFENGVSMGQMERFKGKDPYVAKLYSDKSNLDYKWIYPSETEHLFRAKPQFTNSTIEIRATDRFGNVYSETVRMN